MMTKPRTLASSSGGRYAMPIKPEPIDGVCHCRTPRPEWLPLWDADQCMTCGRAVIRR